LKLCDLWIAAPFLFTTPMTLLLLTPRAMP
jgi:hypothetical protein